MAVEVDEKMKESETQIPNKQNAEKPNGLVQNFSQQEKPAKLIIREEKNPEINLGLSLGGIYSENSNKKQLPRSSSIIGKMKVDKEEDEAFKLLMPKSFPSLSRSCSVLTEAEQQQRKASFIALARKTFESARGFSSVRNMAQKGVVSCNQKSSPVGPIPSKLPAWAAASAAKRLALCRAFLQKRRHAPLCGYRNFGEKCIFQRHSLIKTNLGALEFVAFFFLLFSSSTLDGLHFHAGDQGLAEQKKVAIHSHSFPTEKHKESKIMLFTTPFGKPETKVMLGTSSKVEPELQVVLETSSNVEPELKVMLGTSSNVEPESKAMLGTSSNIEPESKAVLGTSSNVKAELKAMLGTSSNVKPESKVMHGTSSNGKPAKYAESMLQNPPKRVKLLNNGFQDTGMEVMRQMPSVTTIGDGPNGRKIEGFLYKYRRGQVSIVCVCHGSFLSPAEFVRHAGGMDVANPMKRITVCPSFSF